LYLFKCACLACLESGSIICAKPAVFLARSYTTTPTHAPNADVRMMVGALIKFNSAIPTLTTSCKLLIMFHSQCSEYFRKRFGIRKKKEVTVDAACFRLIIDYRLNDNRIIAIVRQINVACC